MRYMPAALFSFISVALFVVVVTSFIFSPIMLVMVSVTGSVVTEDSIAVNWPSLGLGQIWSNSDVAGRFGAAVIESHSLMVYTVTGKIATAGPHSLVMV